MWYISKIKDYKAKIRLFSELFINTTLINLAWQLYYVRYTIVYSDGQRSDSGTNLNLESQSESQAIDVLKRQNNVPQNAQIIIRSFNKP